MRKLINLCFVLLAVAAVVYGLIGRYSNQKAVKETHTMELVKSRAESYDLVADSEEEAVPY